MNNCHFPANPADSKYAARLDVTSTSSVPELSRVRFSLPTTQLPSPGELSAWSSVHVLKQYAVFLGQDNRLDTQRCCFIDASADGERIAVLIAFIQSGAISVAWLQVAPAWRNIGVASRLLRIAVNHAASRKRDIQAVHVQFTELEAISHPVRRALNLIGFTEPMLTQQIFDIDNNRLSRLTWVRPCPSGGRMRVCSFDEFSGDRHIDRAYCEPPALWCPADLHPMQFQSVLDSASSQLLLDQNEKITGWIVTVAVEPGVFAIASLYVHPVCAPAGAIGWLIDNCCKRALSVGVTRATFMTSERFPAMVRVAQRHLGPATWRKRRVFDAFFHL